MPSTQRGQVVRLAGSWGARWYDEHGGRQRQAGFATKSAARQWLDDKVDEVNAVRRGVAVAPAARPTVSKLADLFLELHEVDTATTRKLRAQLRHATAKFGDRQPDTLSRIEVEAWRKTLSAGSRHDVFRAFRQLLAWAVDRKLAASNPSAGIKNAKRKRHERREVHPFETWADVEAVADELDKRYKAIPVFAVGTGLRPEEWIALERADIDREARIVHVRRRFSQGELKEGGKTDGSTRTVPLRQRVLDALDEMPPRIDTKLVFPAPRGGHIDLEKFRHREWTSAVRAAGIDHRRVYDCRHTFATWAIEDGRMSLIHLATIMGTSVRQLEDTYFRWLSRTDEQVRTYLDEYDSASAAGSR
jgi:integrase